MNVRTGAFSSEGPYGLYIHVPFCVSKCPYCHFISTTDRAGLIERYITAIKHELMLRNVPDGSSAPRTIYIGGGTPSLVPAPLLTTLLEDITGPDTIEITIEANPESINSNWLERIRAAGVTRLSIGVQSLDDKVLAVLGRKHNADCAMEALQTALEAGYNSLSADIMFGIPGQNLKSLYTTLEMITSLPIYHLSCYGLTIEEDTVFWKRVSQKLIQAPDQDMSADMYVMIDEYLAEKGYDRYEISNFARPGYTCRHNEAYWDFTPYLGVGISAHSFDGIHRFWNTTDMDVYLKCVENNEYPVDGEEVIDDLVRQNEEFMLALRTSRGISIEVIDSLPPNIRSKVLSKIDQFRKSNFMDIREPDRYILTNKGAILADEIIAELSAFID